MLDKSPRDQVTVEAETVEDALAEISTEFGEDAEIMRAQKVHRGGVGGFFAKEMVQLTARRRCDTPPPLRPTPKGSGIADVLERMAQDADAEDSDFRTVLQRELGAENAQPGPANSLPEASSNESIDEPEDVVEEMATVAVVEAFVPPFAATDDLPEPVAVGPALRSEPEPVDLTPEELAPVTESVVEIDWKARPVLGPVIPLHDPEDEDLDSAATAEIEETTEWPVATPVAVTEPVHLEAVTTDDVEEAQVVPDDKQNWWRTAQPINAPSGMGAVPWSTTALLRLGLPAPLLAAVSGLDGNDDLGWIDGIAAAVAPHCGPLPGEDVIVVGPHAERLAEPLGLPLVHSGDMAPYDGSFCAMVEDTPEDRTWLEFVRGSRGIHLVVGDEPRQNLLIDEPVAVSWVGDSAVANALYLAFTLGATLGFGTVDGFVSSMVRAQPADVALAVRRIVGRR